MTLQWYEVHSPHSRFNVGKIEVDERGKIIRTSPAYRWALGLNFKELKWKWDRDGYHVCERFECPEKALASKKKPSPPSDKELYERVSP